MALQLYEGRELDIVTQAESVEQFGVFRTDLDRFAKASAMLEAVDQALQEGEADPELYNLLVGALRALARRDSPLVVPAFFLKLLAAEGHRPIVESCAGCGSEGELVAFSLEDGGALCGSCRRGSAMSPEALRLLREILGGRLGPALEEGSSPATREVDGLATAAMEQYLERRLRSVGVLGA